ncbi:MAG: hypothetical protein EOO73_05880 [Myxococcales bacterium]|nr:MAG: hypothetical protein EOO73_05880 [Myxococcales bacterium]
MIGEVALARLVGEVRSALRRRPAHEARLAGTLRALAAHSAELKQELLVAVQTVARRGSFERPLYGAAVRALSEQREAGLVPVLAKVLGADDAGGLASLSAACFTRDPSLSEPLSRAAQSRHPVVAFAAEVARLSRGEARGGRIASLAPKIKEAHRIALCSELFLWLLSQPALPVEIAPAIAVLRDAERHLGRWLLLGEVATRAGDDSPLREATSRAKDGPESARAAWSLVAWSLDSRADAPTARPTLELMARLSDRPSAERDATFLFRLAAAQVPNARAALESLVKSTPPGDENAVRAALHLCRDYGQQGYASVLLQVGKSPRKDALRALAAAALFDCGQPKDALRLVSELDSSRHLPALGWSSLVRVSAAGQLLGSVVSEQNFRRVQQGGCA